MSEPALTIERVDGSVVLVTINRPAVHNAVDREVTQALANAVRTVEQDRSIRVAILTGAGEKAFCAGADLRETAEHGGKAVATPDGQFAGFVLAQRRKPWIAAVNGVAAGGGVELMLACEIAIAADHARFLCPEAKRGLIAGAGAVWRLPRLLPKSIANEMLLTGEPIDAATALNYGLLSRVVPAAELRSAALRIAAAIAAAAPLAVEEAAAITRRVYDLDEPALLAMSDAAVARLDASEDMAEGVKAFLEKRAPVWKGR